MKAAFYSGKVCVQISCFLCSFAMVECIANEKYLYCRFQLQFKAKKKKEEETLSYVHPAGHDGKDCMLKQRFWQVFVRAPRCQIASERSGSSEVKNRRI